jgi:hypothetical protein
MTISLRDCGDRLQIIGMMIRSGDTRRISDIRSADESGKRQREEAY